MADVKWIKITTDIFDDEKILLIESLPESDAIIVIWFKLLCLAGKMNNSGVFILSDRIPINVQMLATIFRRKESTVSLAIETFVKFGMVEIVDNVITIPNWGKHQNLDKIESRKEYMREYMRQYRLKQQNKVSLPNGDTDKNKPDETQRKVYSKSNVNALDKDIDKEEDIDKNNIYSPEPKNDSGPKVASLPLNTGEEYPIYQKDLDEWQELYPAVDVKQQLNSMRGWCMANPTKKKTSRGIKRFINGWLQREQDRGGSRNPVQAQPERQDPRKGKKYKTILNEEGYWEDVEVSEHDG